MYSEACVLEHELGHTSPNGMLWDGEQRFWPRAEVRDLEIKSSDNSLSLQVFFREIFTASQFSTRAALPHPLKSAKLLLFEASAC